MVWCVYGCQLMLSFCVSHFCAETFCCFVSKSIGWIICPLKRRQKIPFINQQGWITNPPVPNCWACDLNVKGIRQRVSEVMTFC